MSVAINTIATGSASAHNTHKRLRESATAEWSRLTDSLLDPTAQLSLKASLLPSALTDFLAAVPDDPSRRKPDITRARSELGWEPRVALRDGLSKTIDYFREVTALT